MSETSKAAMTPLKVEWVSDYQIGIHRLDETYLAHDKALRQRAEQAERERDDACTRRSETVAMSEQLQCELAAAQARVKELERQIERLESALMEDGV